MMIFYHWFYIIYTILLFILFNNYIIRNDISVISINFNPLSYLNVVIIFYPYFIYIYIIFNHSNHFSPLGHHFSITNAHVTCTLLKNDKKIWSELYISRQNIKFLKILSFIKTFHPTYSNYTWNLNIFFFHNMFGEWK